jgi:photosystem II stability/assembly factor-like uncharacterized protein
MIDTDPRSDSRGGEPLFEDRLLHELLRLHVELNTIVGQGTDATRGHSDRRVGVRARASVGLVASLAVVVALVVAACVVTLGHGANKPHIRPPLTGVFATPRQTSSATWSLTGLVAAPGWHPQSVGATSAVQLICPTEQTCIASGVDLGVDQLSLPYQQNDIAISNDAGESWRVAEVPPDGMSFNGFTCPTSTTCMTVGVLPNEGNGPPPPSFYVTTDGGATWTVRVMPGVVFSTAALACWTATSCVVVEQTESFTAYVTDDAGRSWTSSQLPARFFGPADSDALQCSGDGRCIAMGIASLAYSAEPTFAYSTDGGRTWELGTTPPVHAGAASVLSCSDALHCTAVENTGVQNGLTEVRGVVTTSDGGRTWTAASAHGLSPGSAPQFLEIGSLACVSPTTCYAAGQSGGSATFNSTVPTLGVVAATSDGGQTWHLESLPTINHHAIGETASITCPSSQTCFVGGFTDLDSGVLLERDSRSVNSQ